MSLKIEDIAKMFDLSCVQMYNTREDVVNLVNIAKKYHCGQVSVLQCFLDFCRQLFKDDKEIKLVGNVSFPSGADSTELKVLQAGQMVEKCDEIDMVMNLCWHKSGMYEEVEKDIAAVKNVVCSKPLKVIIEAPLLDKEQIKKACEICIRAGADFIKTGTGWSGPTTVEHVRIIKAVIGDTIPIKASGGISDLNTLITLYKNGASRFGVNLNKGLSILREYEAKGSNIRF